jgi:hypothetical protein
VVLAAVVLPAFRAVPVVDNNIDNVSVRRQIFSTAVLQDQVIECCCGPTPTPTPAPQSADLRIAQVFSAITDPASGLAGLQLAITVTDLGPSSASNASVTANIPLIGQGILIVQPNSPLTLSGSTLQANLGTMTNGQVMTLTATILPKGVTFPVDIPIVSTASVQSATFDPNLANNNSVAQAQIPVPARVQSIDPTTGQVFQGGITPNKIVVTFTKQLSGSTVNAQTFKVVGPTQGTVSYDPATNTATFAATTNFGNGQYAITLVGTGANPIRDVDGLALDGNGDSKPGGDFVSSFLVSIPQ